VEQRGKVQMLDAWILLSPEHHGDYDPEVVRAVADDVMTTFEGGNIDTGYFDVIADVQMEGKPGKDYTLRDWAKKADGWGTLTTAFTRRRVHVRPAGWTVGVLGARDWRFHHRLIRWREGYHANRDMLPEPEAFPSVDDAW
jgi:hypothetical protein